MIFITVGTHEQQFDRLIKEVDRLKEEKLIDEKVFIQTGYSTYEPKYCEFKPIISYEEMDYYSKEARIIVTHGGPGSIFQAIQYGKKPIVVPRNPDFKEHVDDHQIKFAKRMKEKGRVYLVLDINTLSETILNYQGYDKKEDTNENSNFSYKFNELVNGLFSGGNDE